MYLPYGHHTYSALEKVQCTAARYALNDCPWRSSVTTMLNSLDWPTLESHCAHSKLVSLVPQSNHKVPHLSLNPIYTSTVGHLQCFRPQYMPVLTLTFFFVLTFNH